MESVYKTQCKTFEVAKKMAGQFADVTPLDAILKPPYCLRVLKPWRTPHMQKFRDEVALVIRSART